MADEITFASDGFNWTLILNFATAGATTGAITSITGSFTGTFSGTLSGPVPYNGATNVISGSSPYLTGNGASGGDGISFTYVIGGVVQNDLNLLYNSTTRAYQLVSDAVVGGGTFAVSSLAFDSGACFAEGTEIATEKGWTAVEHLAVNDLVRTASGALRPIRWLGHRSVDCSSALQPIDVLPVCVVAHAFGPERPARDLYLSPGHAVCVNVLDEVLVPISSLINGATIRQIDAKTVTYWHVELDSQDILLSENLLSESYLNTGNRGFFVEAECVNLRPELGARAHGTAGFCRPFHAEGPIVEAVRLQLAARAKALGWQIKPRNDFSAPIYHAMQSIDKGLAVTRKLITTKASQFYADAKKLGSSEGAVRAEQIVESLPATIRRALRAYSRGELVWTTADGNRKIMSTYKDNALVELANDVQRLGLDSIFELLEEAGGLEAIATSQGLGRYGHS